MQFVVLDDVFNKMCIYCEESFGFVVLIICVQDVEEVILVVNDIDYGFVVVVFGQDVDCCMEIVDWFEIGICQINGLMVFDDLYMFFGGMKVSGYGCFGGMIVIDEFIEM